MDIEAIKNEKFERIDSLSSMVDPFAVCLWELSIAYCSVCRNEFHDYY